VLKHVVWPFILAIVLFHRSYNLPILSNPSSWREHFMMRKLKPMYALSDEPKRGKDLIVTRDISIDVNGRNLVKGCCIIPACSINTQFTLWETFYGRWLNDLLFGPWGQQQKSPTEALGNIDLLRGFTGIDRILSFKEIILGNKSAA
jgi:hypothetical protein